MQVNTNFYKNHWELQLNSSKPKGWESREKIRAFVKDIFSTAAFFGGLSMAVCFWKKYTITPVQVGLTAACAIISYFLKSSDDSKQLIQKGLDVVKKVKDGALSYLDFKKLPLPDKLFESKEVLNELFRSYIAGSGNYTTIRDGLKLNNQLAFELDDSNKAELRKKCKSQILKDYFPLSSVDYQIGIPKVFQLMGDDLNCMRGGQELTCADITDYDEEVVATLRSYVMNKCQNISTSEALKRADVKKLKITEDQLNAASGSQLVTQPATKPVLNNPLIEKPPIKLSSVASLVAEYNSNWNADEKCFDDIPVNIERVKKVLNKSISRYRNQIKELGIDLDDKDFEEAHYGFIMKKDLEPASRIFVRADLHADLKSLLENLNEIQKAGLLDEKFKCQPGVELVFLGDYTDRGQHDLQVLELLACLRLENPDQVHLLKGNHEDLMINKAFTESQELKDFIDGEDTSSLLNDFYNTLPLTVYMSEKREGKRQYVHFTHGLFELMTDPSDLLDKKKSVAAMPIPKEQEFSSRVKEITDSEKPENMSKKQKRRFIKLQKAALVISDLAYTYLLNRPQFVEEYGEQYLSTYNWGDVGDESYMGFPGNRSWLLSPEDVKHYMRLCGGEKSKVKMVIRGHQHKHEHYNHYKVQDKVIMTTLTVAMEHPGYQSKFSNQLERAYILTTGPKVHGGWQKQGLLRQAGASTSILTEVVSISSDEA